MFYCYVCIEIEENEGKYVHIKRGSTFLLKMELLHFVMFLKGTISKTPPLFLKSGKKFRKRTEVNLMIKKKLVKIEKRLEVMFVELSMNLY